MVKSKPPNETYLQRPEILISNLYTALKNQATSYSGLTTGETIKISPGDDYRLWLVEEGMVSAFRKRDDLLMWNANGLVIIGISQLFCSTNAYYFKVKNGQSIYNIEHKLAREIIENNHLWYNVSALLDYYIRIFNTRDAALVNKSSYDTIREKIMEYDLLGLNESNRIAPYILDTTLLSKSIVYKIVSDLHKGGYLFLSKGKATILKELPKKY